MNRIYEYVPDPDVHKRTLDLLGNMKPHKDAKLIEADRVGEAQEIVDHWHDYGTVPSTHVRKAVQLPHHGTTFAWMKV